MILLVVYIHFNGESLGSPAAGTLGCTVYDSIRIMMCHVVSRSAVPVFFLISGYYFFYRTEFNREAYLRKLKKRVGTLLAPYFLWNLLLLGTVLGGKLMGVLLKGKPWGGILDYLQEKGYWDIFWSCSEWGTTTNWLGVTIDPTSTSPLLVPTWFLRDLIVMCLISPALYICIRKMGRWFIALLLLSYVSKVAFYVPGFSATSLLFFSTGAYFAIKGKSALEAFRRIRIPSYVIYLLLLVPSIWLDGPYTRIGGLIHPWFVCIGVSVYVNLAADLFQNGWAKPYKALSQSVFFIYGLHTILVLGITGSIVGKFLPWNNGVIACVRYLLVPILCVAICYGIYRGMMRFCPRITSLFTGNR